MLQHVPLLPAIVGKLQSGALEKLNYTNTEAKLFHITEYKSTALKLKIHTQQRLDRSTLRLALLWAQNGRTEHKQIESIQRETFHSQTQWVNHTISKELNNMNAGDILSLHRGEQIKPELCDRLSLLPIKVLLILHLMQPIKFFSSWVGIKTSISLNHPQT